MCVKGASKTRTRLRGKANGKSKPRTLVNLVSQYHFTSCVLLNLFSQGFTSADSNICVHGSGQTKTLRPLPARPKYRSWKERVRSPTRMPSLLSVKLRCKTPIPGSPIAAQRNRAQPSCLHGSQNTTVENEEGSPGLNPWTDHGFKEARTRIKSETTPCSRW